MQDICGNMYIYITNKSLCFFIKLKISKTFVLYRPSKSGKVGNPFKIIYHFFQLECGKVFINTQETTNLVFIYCIVHQMIKYQSNNTVYYNPHLELGVKFGVGDSWRGNQMLF